MASELSIASELILKFFELDEGERQFLSDITENQSEIEALLSRRIGEMLKDEMEALINAMYRIDVSEIAFHEAMAHDDRADRIAQLVVERLIQKAKTRIWYRENS
jgi:hypothetical protein